MGLGDKITVRVELKNGEREVIGIGDSLNEFSDGERTRLLELLSYAPDIADISLNPPRYYKRQKISIGYLFKLFSTLNYYYVEISQEEHDRLLE